MTAKATTTAKTTTAAAATEAPLEYVVSSHKVTAETPIKYIENPKRKNSASYARYEKYQTATTWGEYMKLNDGKFMMADARHDLGKSFLTINPSK